MTSRGSDLTVGSASEAQCRRVAMMTSSPSRRYLATSFRARRPSHLVRCGPLSGGRRAGGEVTSDQGADEVRERGRDVAERVAGAADERGRGLGKLDHVEDDEGDDQPGDDLLEVHRHLRGALAGQAPWTRNPRGRGPPGVANRFVPWVTQVPATTGPTRRPGRGPPRSTPTVSRPGGGARWAGRVADPDTGGRAGRAARAAPRAARRRSS